MFINLSKRFKPFPYLKRLLISIIALQLAASGGGTGNSGLGSASIAAATSPPRQELYTTRLTRSVPASLPATRSGAAYGPRGQGEGHAGSLWTLQRRTVKLRGIGRYKEEGARIAAIRSARHRDMMAKGVPIMRLMRYAKAVLCAGLVLASSSALAETFDRGQALYENHCQSCHEETVHMRESRRAGSIEELRERVASWSYHAALGWSAEEIADVVDYLDRRFYRFPEQP